ncbi:MAG: imidazolonepropionase [Saprospiraceae bacterium]|nr:imidazolonepropionase [Saprospiraceae bacterium]MCF8250452.1 imidazolonepropionase [Saprospiraceae bacterium]MCF8282107.1 imidazolonepropionase [Bacteroidales bacterium]MCF8312402.1 imidazolonepropionase [Saprospiraceae bacterium]MCF8440601.1 imidazolonepropionase [Saprospiraceae bacterium]
MLITNIKQLALTEEKARTTPLRGAELAKLSVVENAFLSIENQRIVDFGEMADCPLRADKTIDATGRFVLPAWCDSHTHLVFSHSREEEWVNRIKGMSYEEIANLGGGILNSANRLQATPEEQLFEQASERLEEVRKTGTGLIEIKSGYGLTVESELKMLRVIRRLKESSDVEIKATFLGAHSMPMAFRNGNRQGYISLIINEMLPQIANEGLADYVDVFCEKLAFSVEEMEQVLVAGAKYGLRPKVHVNQFNCMGGIAAAMRHGAVSVDHLELVDDADIEAMRNGNTIATLLPSAPFFLQDHTPPARQLLDANVPVALASDYNPGTSPSGRIPFVVSLACIMMKMMPEEAIQAATLNGAFALEAADDFGSIAKGKFANLIVTKPMPSLAYLPYSFGSDIVERVVIKGK